MLPSNKCFYSFDTPNAGPANSCIKDYKNSHFSLQLTDAFINNLFRSLYLDFNQGPVTHMNDKNLWVDAQNWELSEIGLPEDMFSTKEKYNENRYTTNPATGLPREVWTS
jgi:hypothetical protein